jgi:hypothetical protein
MKRYMTRVSLLLLTSMLVSCGGGGGGDSPSGGGSPGTPSGGNPGNGNAGGAPLPSAGAHVEESDAAVTLSGEWKASDERFGWSGGHAKFSTEAKATASFTFTGTSVTWIGSRGRGMGIALVKVDGGTRKGVDLFEVDLFARPNDEIRAPVLTLNGLSDGKHTLTIEVTGDKNPDADSNVVVVDAFDVQAPIMSRLQQTDPDVIFGAGWGLNNRFAWSGGGVFNAPDGPVGAMVTETTGATVTLTFRGTSIRWIGYRGPNAGIARVMVDGGKPSDVDTYSPTDKVQEVVFTATGLADASHTLTITATGQKNGASEGAQIVVDAFDVTTPGRRFEQGDPAITYTSPGSGWDFGNDNRTWSEGVAATNFTPGARATFSFTGTSVSWIGCEKASIGRARIYLDGGFVKDVRMFRPFPIEGYQRTIFRVDGLTNGPHTLTIEVLGEGYTVIDAFDVHP